MRTKRTGLGMAVHTRIGVFVGTVITGPLRSNISGLTRVLSVVPCWGWERV